MGALLSQSNKTIYQTKSAEKWGMTVSARKHRMERRKLGRGNKKKDSKKGMKPQEMKKSNGSGIDGVISCQASASEALNEQQSLCRKRMQKDGNLFENVNGELLREWEWERNYEMKVHFLFISSKLSLFLHFISEWLLLQIKGFWNEHEGMLFQCAQRVRIHFHFYKRIGENAWSAQKMDAFHQSRIAIIRDSTCLKLIGDRSGCFSDVFEIGSHLRAFNATLFQRKNEKKTRTECKRKPRSTRKPPPIIANSNQ